MVIIIMIIIIIIIIIIIVVIILIMKVFRQGKGYLTFFFYHLDQKQNINT